MPINLEIFSEEEITRVVQSYLVSGDSYRSIQKNILGLPAPTRGGGYIVMEIIHHFDINGEHKGILRDNPNFIPESKKFKEAIGKVNEFVAIEKVANAAINSRSVFDFDSSSKTELSVITKQRIGQSMLRKVVLDNYQNMCALCAIHQKDLLICSHIVPWKTDKKNRLNPSNAIILCCTHDKLFDKGYYSLDDEYNIILSKKSDQFIADLLKNYSFRRPLKDNPDIELLKHHRLEVCEIMI